MATEPVMNALQPRSRCTRPKEQGPQDGEDPTQSHLHFVRGTELRKLRRERTRQAQGQGQATEHKHAFYARDRRPQTSHQEPAEACDG
jgi:hypothetical protein